jgi:beta-galactosidase
MTRVPGSNEGYRFSGEFHYFRVPRKSWPDRLSQVRDLGFEGVSVYVPWNWHEPEPGAIDFTGRTLPERDLLGALDEIAAAGLTCIYRPGPFITAEWGDGGIPAWLWQRDPSIVALNSAGRSAGAGRPYPALTYSHPGFAGPAADWLGASIRVAAGHMASAGGPIVHLQLDDETSYWQQLRDPLALDYNPYLVASDEGRPSRYGGWLLDRYESIRDIDRAHGTRSSSAPDLEPPRRRPEDRAELPRYLDWLDFKLDQINDFILGLHSAARAAGYEGPISMLFPYLQPLEAARFAEFARNRMPDLRLTDECYVSLFSPSVSPEQKVAQVIACHETYHMWRGPGQGPAFAMELQGSNSSFLPAGVMEMLYAVTLARGIRGFNIYMLVGGENPAGFEAGTGRAYDLDAPIGAAGEIRPHADVLARHIRVIRAIEPQLIMAQPLRDTWIGAYRAYEGAAIGAGRGLFDDLVAANSGIFAWGDTGLSNASSLTALLTLAGASWGAVDLERGDGYGWALARQIWVPGLAFMARPIQRRLVDWIAEGGHAVVMPAVPLLDESMQPCDVLARAIFGGASLPAFEPFEAEPAGWSQIRFEDGRSCAAPGRATRFELPPGALPLARTPDGAVVAFRRPIGLGSATVLGFRLQYHPVGGTDQFEIAASIVEQANGPRAAVAERLPVVALELAGAEGGLLCVVNPVEPAVTSRVRYTVPGTTERAILPVGLPGLEFPGRGARLLPIGIYVGGGRRLRYATAELIERREDPAGTVRLAFAARVGEQVEIAREGPIGPIGLEHARLAGEKRPEGEMAVLVVEALAREVTVALGPPRR